MNPTFTKLSVVVPCHNEAENVARFAGELLPALDNLGVRWELILVDDGSVDATAVVARGLCFLCPESQVVTHRERSGLGSALRSGFAAATGDWVLTLDADLTFQPKDVAALVARAHQGDVDVVSGSPFLAGFAGVPWYRIALSRIANLLYQLALQRRLTAVTPIFRLYRRSLLGELALDSTGFEINAEILVKAILRGARVAEVPASLGTRRFGVSKLDNRKEVANHLRLLRRIVAWRRDYRGGGRDGGSYLSLR